MFFTPAVHLRRGTSLINTLSNLGLLTNLKGCYDFADSNCYSGSGQTINDLSGQGNNIFNGSSSSNTAQDMVFNGVAGRMSASEYFERNATTGFATLGGTVPAWMNAVHKDGGKISIVQWTKTPSGTYGIGSFTTYLVIDGSGTTQYPGFTFGVSGGFPAPLGYPHFAATDNSGGSVGYFSGTAVVPNTGEWMFSGCAISEAAGTAVIQINSTVYSGSISYSSPSTSNAGGALGMGPSGASIHQKNAIAFWDESIGADGLNAIFNATRGRFGV